MSGYENPEVAADMAAQAERQGVLVAVDLIMHRDTTPGRRGTDDDPLDSVEDMLRRESLFEDLLALPTQRRQARIAELLRRDAREGTQRLLQAPLELPAPIGLHDLLSRPARDPDWVFENLHEEGTNTSLTATYKTGKTVTQLNEIGALADGEPLFGYFATKPLSGRIGYFNYELTEDQAARWLRELGIRNVGAVDVFNLRGFRADMLADDVHAWAVNWLRRREIEFWFIDPLARAYYGDENDNQALKLWTDVVDEIKREAGCLNAQVSLHTGRAAQVEGEERARGATRIDDWVDARWVLTKLNGDRFLAAIGRDAEVEETRLKFDPDTKRLTIAGAVGESRKLARDDSVVRAVCHALHEMGGSAPSQNKITERMVGDSTDRIASVKRAVALGYVHEDDTGRGRPHPHTLTDAGREFLGGTDWQAEVARRQVPPL